MRFVFLGRQYIFLFPVTPGKRKDESRNYVVYFSEKNGENQKEYLDKSNYNYSGKKNQRDIERLIQISTRFDG